MRHLFTKTLALITFVAMAYLTNAQSNIGEKWQNYTYAQEVTSFAEDGSAYYIGTKGGLVQIDKETESLSVLNKANSPLPSNMVESVVIDKTDKIWIGTYDAGIAFVDHNNWSTMDESNSDLPSDIIYNLMLDGQDNLWVGCKSGMWKKQGDDFIRSDTASLFHWAPKKALFDESRSHTWYISEHSVVQYDGTAYIDHSMELKMYGVKEISIDNAGYIWVSSSSSIGRFDGTTWEMYETFNTNPNLPGDGSFYAFAIDNNGNFNTVRGSDLLTYQNGSWTVTSLSTFSFPHYVNRMFFDNDNALWLISGDMAYHQRTNTWDAYPLSNASLQNNYIMHVFADKDGKGWASDLASRIHRYDGYSWLMLDYPAGMSSTSITELEAYNNKLYVATTSKGLYVYDGTEWDIYNTANSDILSDEIWDMDIDKYGKIWMATKEHGLMTFDGNNWMAYMTINSDITSNRVYEVAVSEDGGMVWFTTDKLDLTSFDGQEFKTVSTVSLFGAYTNISAMTVDKNGLLWLGGYDVPLSSYDGKTLSHYQTNDPVLKSNRAITIDADDHGNIWLGTNDHGFMKFDGQDFTFYTYDETPITSQYIMDVSVSGNKIWTAAKPQDYSHKGSGGISVLTTIPATAVAESKQADNINMYPNPAANMINLQLDMEQAGQVTVSIYNTAGQEVRTLDSRIPAGKQVMTLNTNNLQDGLYLCRITLGDRSLNTNFVISR